MNSLKNVLPKLSRSSRMSSTATGSSRRMKYPYTITAKIAQFPYKFHFDNMWLYRYFIPGYLVSYIAFIYIHKTVNSPGAKAAYKELQRKQAEKEAEAHDH